jgi:hypothetical protein
VNLAKQVAEMTAPRDRVAAVSASPTAAFNSPLRKSAHLVLDNPEKFN